MHNKYATCQWCPDRCLGCRATCDGWQAREQEKAVRNELSAQYWAGKPVHYANERAAMKEQRRAQMRGR